MVTEVSYDAIGRVINYWFGDIGSGFDVQGQNKLWFGGGDSADEDIRQKFGELVDSALAGELLLWTDSILGSLALVILLDQFPRNIYRGSAQAFAGDKTAVEIVKNSIKQQLDKQLSAIQRSFFYMPLEHSENFSDQNVCVECFEQLLQEVPDEGKKIIQSNLEFALKHRDIIAQFGRFPHRNKALARESSAAEIGYLNSGGARFGQ